MDWAALLATVAAFTAAIFAWWNVSRAAAYSRSNELQKWRREVLLPAFSDFVEAIDVSLRGLDSRRYLHWKDVEQAEAIRMEAEAIAAMEEVKRTNAKVELVATPEVLEAAADLRNALDRYEHRTRDDFPPKGVVFTTEHPEIEMKFLLQECADDAARRRTRFIEEARDSLGIPGGDMLYERVSARLERMETRDS